MFFKVRSTLGTKRASLSSPSGDWHVAGLLPVQDHHSQSVRDGLADVTWQVRGLRSRDTSHLRAGRIRKQMGMALFAPAITVGRWVFLAPLSAAALCFDGERASFFSGAKIASGRLAEH